jgi:hypothetical protein
LALLMKCSISVSLESASATYRSTEVERPCSRAAPTKASPCVSSASPLAHGPNAGIVTQKRPSDWNSYGSEDRGTTVQISWTNFIRSYDFSTSRLADAEFILRVRAKMIIPEQLGAENDSSMTAPPFFPVAPSTAMILFLFIVILYAEYLG